MLVFVTTDAARGARRPAAARGRAAEAAVQRVDGRRLHQSTNDTVLLFASGAAGGDAGHARTRRRGTRSSDAIGEVGESLVAPADRRRRGRHARDAGRRRRAPRRARRARGREGRGRFAAREDRGVRRRPEPRPDPAGGRARRASTSTPRAIDVAIGGVARGERRRDPARLLRARLGARRRPPASR